MDSTAWFLGSMVLLGSLHTVLLVYLKYTGRHPDLYIQLRFSKWLIFMMALTGFLIGFFLSNSYSPEESGRMIALILGFMIGVPLFIIGIGSLNLIVRFIRSLLR
jgi:hypothetical protein